MTSIFCKKRGNHITFTYEAWLCPWEKPEGCECPWRSVEVWFCLCGQLVPASSTSSAVEGITRDIFCFGSSWHILRKSSTWGYAKKTEDDLPYFFQIWWFVQYTRDGAWMKIIKTWFANTDCEFLYCKLFTALEASMALTGGTGSSRYIHWFFFASTKINLVFVIEPACHTSIYTKALCCRPNHTEFLLNGCWQVTTLSFESSHHL